MKRLLSASRSPIFAHFCETQSGVSTIRAYRMENAFRETMQRNINETSTFFYTNVVLDVWLGLRLEWVCIFFSLVILVNLV